MRYIISPLVFLYAITWLAGEMSGTNRLFAYPTPTRVFYAVQGYSWDFGKEWR